MIVRLVAMRSEARPIIEAEKLQGEPTPTPWPLYRSRCGGRALVISGVGRTAMAGAAGWAVGHLTPPAHAGWVNLGIAGHSAAAVGTSLIAHKVVDRASGRAWYPPGLPGLDLPSDTLFTVDEPEFEYPAPGAWDMEAAAFLEATARWSLVELTQVVKVVSDNPDASAERLDADAVSALIAARLDDFEAVAASLRAIAARLTARRPDSALMDAVVEGRRFTVTQRRQLARLLERYRALTGSDAEPKDWRAADAGGTLSALSRAVENLAAGE